MRTRNQPPKSAYAADITTRSGYHHAVFGIEPDAQGHFTLAETHFADGESNFVRIRGEGEALSSSSVVVREEALARA